MKKILFVTTIILMFFFVGCDNDLPKLWPEPPKTDITVFEYLPAPGQFINESPGFNGVTTIEAAREYAKKRLNGSSLQHISLGGFGGYIVVGLGESIANSGKNDFSVTGNQFVVSSEPGIVWVMQDTNSDGVPNDTWHELRGSETGKEGTIRNYEVTYYRPDVENTGVEWTDNMGGSGIVPRNSTHEQSTYYPAWITTESYSLAGTLLESRTRKNEETGEWVNGLYEWGYADNWGSDRGEGDDQRKVYFKISNAIDADGDPADLQSIDFIKVQSAVNANAGSLGEVSTEVLGFAIENKK